MVYAVLFNSQLDVYGGFSGKLESSIVRYLMPTWIIVAILSAACFARGNEGRAKHGLLGRWGLALALAIFVTVLVSAYPATRASAEEKVANMERYERVAAQFNQVTAPGDIVFSGYWSKIIFPERRVATFFSDTNISQIADAIVFLEDSGYRTLFVNDGVVSRDRLALELEARGYAFSLFDRETGIYEIIPKNLAGGS